MVSIVGVAICTAVGCIASLSAGHIGELGCQPPPAWRDYGRTCVCMLVIIRWLGVTATPDLKIESIRPAVMCSATRMTCLAARTHYYPSLARGVFVRYASTESSNRD